MNRFLLDTNIVLAYLRGHALYQQIENDHQLFDPGAAILVSVATKAELLSLGIQNNWSKQKLGKLAALLQRLFVMDINEADHSLMEAYAQIDAFSQGKLPGKALGTSARNMGKNDLWIAATAHVSNSTLITTDGDFDHLQGNFISLVKYAVP
ncbi:MAG: type II toxin-antitoxin system VapC family toxin [Saprospiraceae bacterium]|nr:MAG: type II toxin-antitoxin system VapC family toxin [Saprospiraceae bacterium]